MLLAVSDDVGIELSSRLVSKQVLLPQQSLTSVFGMGTGGPSALKIPTGARYSRALTKVLTVRSKLPQLGLPSWTQLAELGPQ